MRSAVRQPPALQAFQRSPCPLTRRLERLVRRLIELTRAESATATDEASSVSQALAGLGATPPLTLDLRAGGETRLAISAEALGIVLANLLDNAARHEATRMAVTVRPQAGRARIELSDDGAGVSAANRARIFEPFFTTRRESGGTGLGLGIVAALLKAHHGTIRLDDTESGAGFTIELPLAGVLPSRNIYGDARASVGAPRRTGRRRGSRGGGAADP